jgi:hypothetical protein
MADQARKPIVTRLPPELEAMLAEHHRGKESALFILTPHRLPRLCRYVDPLRGRLKESERREAAEMLEELLENLDRATHEHVERHHGADLEQARALPGEDPMEGLVNAVRSLTDLPPVVGVAAVMARYALRDRRAARRLMDAAGGFLVAGRLVVRVDDLDAHELALRDARRAAGGAQGRASGPHPPCGAPPARTGRGEPLRPGWWRTGEGG